MGDIRGMLDISGEAIDHQALNGWVSKLALTAEWEQVTPAA